MLEWEVVDRQERPVPQRTLLGAEGSSAKEIVETKRAWLGHGWLYMTFVELHGGLMVPRSVTTTFVPAPEEPCPTTV